MSFLILWIQGRSVKVRSEQGHDSEAEVDVSALISRLWRQWFLIAVTTLAAVIGATVYVCLAGPVYDARIYVRAPVSTGEMTGYGRGRGSGLEPLGATRGYSIYLSHLQSDGLRREFYERFYLPSASDDDARGGEERRYKEFKAALMVGAVSNEKILMFSVRALTGNPDQAADWVVRYAELAGQRTKEYITKSLKADILFKIRVLEQEFSPSQVGMRGSVFAWGASAPIPMDVSRHLPVKGVGEFMAVHGGKAINTQRLFGSPLVLTLQQRQENLLFYRGLKINDGLLKVYQVEGATELSDGAVRPRKAMVIAAGFLLGLLSGCGLACVRDQGVRTRRAKRLI
ncbi:hypothetical protein KSS94_07130 [Pseudomonas fakonensis]|uniref:Polysaccharide chain length determinant N-terminal domain-containing protein n=1 Tax=Pseudomonas fakonensis TaxID=2842355 RepID=A0ABX8N9F5_9PSED|nr:Wzz/FepE/Etk N-terminal domain-containing protein [Pseudomonas fakonensis]QXH52897.1 hypothetical protein KSS94_07130 [Pseudomonas fakonensis]